MSIGEAIYKNRKKACLSQEELADLLNVTRQSISLWETDQTLPSTANLVRLAEIFHISMDELCGKETEKTSSECLEKTSTVYTKQLEESTDKSRQKIKRALIVLFALSIVSILFALLVCFVCTRLSPLPEFSMTMLEYMWVFYLFIPVPVASTILGFIFICKKYKCKKNIIAGVIMTALLAIYGSFTPMMTGTVKHDFKFVHEVENNVPISLPDNGYVSYTVGKNDDLIAEAMVKFDNKQELLENIERDNWINSASLLPNGIVPLFTVATTNTYDYFYLYDLDCKDSNSDITGTHTGHTFIYFAYSKNNNVMQIVCFSI